MESDQHFTEQLTRLIRVGNQLASAPSVDELCRQAVQTGLQDLSFERMSIWLVDSARKLICGTFGTDESGKMRDERAQSHPWSENMHELELLQSPKTLFRRSQVSLFNEANEVVGTGEVGAAALWNGEDVIGLLYIDNLLTHQPISENHWRLFELYASILGYLLSLKRTESALRSNEELLSQILEILPVGIFVIAPEHRISRYNGVSQEIWEFDPATLAHWMPVATWLENGRPIEDHEWAGERALTLGVRTLNQEVEIVRKDGTRRILLNSGVPLRDASGAPNGAVVVNQDITESKRREQQLEALARMSQALRPLTGRHGVLSVVVEQMLKLLRAKGVALLLSNEEQQAICEATAGDFAPLNGDVVPNALVNEGTELRQDLRLLDTDDPIVRCIYKKLEQPPAHSVIAPLVAQSAAVGAVVVGIEEMPDEVMLSLIGALADVAANAIQRGQLYEEITTQAYQLDRVMESVDFGLVLLDAQRRVVIANQHLQTKLNHIGKVQVGEELFELGGQKLGRFLTPRNNQSRTQEISTEGVIYEITTVPVGATGAEGGWLMVIHDVTRERSIQSSLQQHQRLAAVGQLAAGIAHDFNNIIAVILLYVQMLQRNATIGESDQKRLVVIRDQAHNASRLIRQILDFSRQSVIERQPVDLKALIQESVTLWERTLPETITYHLVMEVDGPAQILAEASSIQQALTNMALNARDAMPYGGELTLLLRSVAVRGDEVAPVTGLKAGVWYQLYVMDTGEGILSEHLPHIFDPFFTTKGVGKGTGLGLAQVYGIIQQHGGMVTAQSEVGEGTTICLFLPALLDPAQVTPENEPLDVVAEGTETILLVEDNTPAREATSALLEMMGYRVFAAVDGRAGLDLFRRHLDSIQLVLSDLVMPEMGGVELHRLIRNENPSVGLIIMTGYAHEDENALLQDQGIVDWLQKPFTVKQLTDAVRRALDRAKSVDEEQDGME